jgi:chromosome segregation ATPase
MTVTVDALYFLLLIEFALIMFIVSVYLFTKNRKHKRLYERASKDLSAARETIKDMEQAAGADMRQTAEYFQQEGAQAIIEQQQAGIAEMRQSVAESRIEKETETATEEVAAETAVDEDTLKGKVRKMQRIIDSQKGKILDLMCYKDIFEGAQKKLLSLSKSFQELQGRFVKLLEQSPDNDAISESLKFLEVSNKELESYIDILNRENDNLLRKFESWEEELKKITEEAEHREYIEEGMQDRIAQEKEEMLAKIKEFEDKLKEKDNQLSNLQKQYEDIEKEYMTLYRQQQQQQK